MARRIASGTNLDAAQLCQPMDPGGNSNFIRQIKAALCEIKMDI
jgi:hypothetical protein